MPTKKSIKNTSENDDSLAGQDETTPVRGDLTTKPLGEADLAEMRQGLEDQEPKSPPFVNTGSLGEFFKKVTDRLRPVGPATTKALEPSPDDSKVQFYPKQPNPPATRKLFPFNDNESFPDNTPEPPLTNHSPRYTGDLGQRQIGNIAPRPATGNIGSRQSGNTSPLGNKKTAINNPLNKLAQKLDSQPESPLSRLKKSPDRKLLPGRFEKDKQLNYQEDLRNPFVSDEDLDTDEGNESLAVKIKNGTVPAETLRLLITESMSEAEVLAICSDLNIDWESVPGETRGEKTQYLIEYFNNHETHLDYKEVATTLRSHLSADEQQDWGESDARLKELQDALTGNLVDNSSREEPQEEEQLSFFAHLREDFVQATPLQKMLVVGLSVIVVALLIVIAFVAFPLKMPAAPVPRFTALPSTVPSPRALELPGGWTFNLKPGVVQDGAWRPDGAEWLQGTEFCRLISLPWNRQLDAVYGTFQVGDELLLTMSNSDLLRYRVTALKTIDLMDFDSDDLNQVANGSSPCLAFVLTRDGVETRQMIVAAPVYISPLQSAVTATPSVTETMNPAFPTVTRPAPATALPTKKP